MWKCNIKMAVLVIYIWCFLFAEKSKGCPHLHISSGFGQKGGNGLLWNYIHWLFSSMGQVHCVTLASSELTMSDEVGLELTEIASVIGTLFLRVPSVMEVDRVKYTMFQALVWVNGHPQTSYEKLWFLMFVSCIPVLIKSSITTFFKCFFPSHPQIADRELHATDFLSKL